MALLGFVMLESGGGGRGRVVETGMKAKAMEKRKKRKRVLFKEMASWSWRGVRV